MWGEILDLEQLGTTAVINAISKTDRLKAFVNNGDKEPSFDGNIYIYDNDKYKKNNIKRVSVQVKGKGTHSKAKNTIKYSISVIDLDNYMRNGGVVFFVVYINPETGEIKKIYYSELLPFKIKKLLKSKKDESKTISIKFNQFPTDKNKITELFLNFYSNSQKQISFISWEIPKIEDLSKNGMLDSVTFSYISVQENNGVASFPKILDGQELYLYANIKGNVASVPIDYFSEITQIQISCVQELPVCVNGEIYYSDFEKNITSDNIICKIGSSVTIILPNIEFTEENIKNMSVTFNINLKGSLKQRIRALEFLIAMFQNENLEFCNMSFAVNFPETELAKFQPSRYPEMLKSYERILAVMEKLNVKKDLPLDDFTVEDQWKLNALVDAIEYGTPLKHVKGELSGVVNICFCGLRFMVLCEKQDDGSYLLWDFFNKQIDVYVLDEDKKSVYISKYCVMSENDFLTADNLKLQSIVDDFKRIEPHQYIYKAGNNIMLEMLKAYDKRPNKELFDAVQQIYAWLAQEWKHNDEEFMEINKLQIMRRERPLTFNEKQVLYHIAASSNNNMCRIGAFILLDEQLEAEYLLGAMSQNEKNEFMSFPIFHFYTKLTEEKNNG